MIIRFLYLLSALLVVYSLANINKAIFGAILNSVLASQQLYVVSFPPYSTAAFFNYAYKH